MGKYDKERFKSTTIYMDDYRRLEKMKTKDLDSIAKVVGYLVSKHME